MEGKRGGYIRNLSGVKRKSSEKKSMKTIEREERDDVSCHVCVAMVII
jgi:hypothetical protein